MSLATKGVVPPEAALALVLGANLGSAVNPLLEGAIGDDLAAKRLPLGNLVNRIIGVSVALPLLPYLEHLMTIIEPNPAREVAGFHTLFNLVLAGLFFPLLSPYAGLLRRWLPTRITAADPARPIYLDFSAREAPAVALGGSAREALRLADMLEAMLQGLRDAFVHGNHRQIPETKPMANTLDKLNSAIKTYLTNLDPEAMTDADQRRVQEILCFTVNIEHAGDIVEHNLLGLVAKAAKRGLAYSKEGQAELLEVIDRLIVNVQTAASLFITEDARAARLLATEKAAFRDIEARATNAHFERLRAGRVETVETSSIHLAMLRDLKRVNTHLVASAAYPVLEGTGELLPNRLRHTGLDSDG